MLIISIMWALFILKTMYSTVIIERKSRKYRKLIKLKSQAVFKIKFNILDFNVHDVFVLHTNSHTVFNHTERQEKYEKKIFGCGG